MDLSVEEIREGVDYPQSTVLLGTPVKVAASPSDGQSLPPPNQDVAINLKLSPQDLASASDAKIAQYDLAEIKQFFLLLVQTASGEKLAIPASLLTFSGGAGDLSVSLSTRDVRLLNALLIPVVAQGGALPDGYTSVASNPPAPSSPPPPSPAVPVASGPTVGDGTILTSRPSFSSVQLDWLPATAAASTPGALSYRVYYSASAAMGTVSEVEAATSAGAAISGTSTIVSGLTADATYYFNVVVTDSAGKKSVYNKVAKKIHPTISLVYQGDAGFHFATNASGAFVSNIMASIPTNSDGSMLQRLADGRLAFINVPLAGVANPNFVTMLTSADNGANWQGTTLDFNLRPGSTTVPSFIDRQGHYHVTYNGTDLNSTYHWIYLSNETGSPVRTDLFSSSVAGSYPGTPVGMVVDAAGVTHLCGGKIGDGGLYYYTNATGAFVETAVTPAGGPDALNCVIRLDSHAKIHIFYTEDTSGLLKYATNASGAWTTETVDQGAGNQYAMIIDTAGGDTVHLVYYGKGPRTGIVYAKGHAGSWTYDIIENFTTIYGVTIDMLVDSGGNAHIGYCGAMTGNLEMKYATGTLMNWQTSSVETNLQGSPFGNGMHCQISLLLE